MNNPKNPDICKAMEHISNAIFYLNKAMQEQEDLTSKYELWLVKENLEMSQRIILNGLFHT